jgi:AhpD family alkylhydroperoxidase
MITAESHHKHTLSQKDRVTLKKKTSHKTDKRLEFRQTLKSTVSVNPESKEIYDEIERKSGVIPEIYRVKALADNPSWLRLLHGTVFQWPKSCSLDEKTKELVGLAKSIGHLWEPGILTNIEGAIEAGATPEEISETILVASIVVGLSNIEHALQAGHFDKISEYQENTLTTSDDQRKQVFDDALTSMGQIPELYRFTILAENMDWLMPIHTSSKMCYSQGALERKTKALVCLGASAAKQWDKGVQDHARSALAVGATPKEIADVLCSIYKTSVSIGVQAGFGVPCSIPEMSGFKLLKDHYAKMPTRHKVKRRR